MKAKIFPLFLIFFLFGFKAFSQTINIDSLNSHNAYRVGEKLVYSVKYRLIKGGEAVLTLDILQNGDNFVYYAKADAYTTGAAKTLANIHDTYESYFDMFTGLPVRATRTIQENHYWSYNDVIFNQDSGYVWSLKSGVKKVPTPILDLLSAFYFARKNLFNQPFHKNQVINLTTYFDDQVFPLRIRYKKTEKIRTKFGKVQALLFVPVIEGLDTKLLKKEDDLKIWFSDDGNYIPLKIQYKSPYGRVKVQLIDFDHLNYPFGVNKEQLKKLQSQSN
jgi:hypothetical protein